LVERVVTRLGKVETKRIVSMIWLLLEVTVLFVGFLAIFLVGYWFVVDLTRPFICTYHYDGHCEVVAHEHCRPEPWWKQMVRWVGLVLFGLLFVLGGLKRFGF